MLSIADQCSLDDRHLVVRGKLQAYRIHLGSGNIMMASNNQYLCIVPAPGSENGRVRLPFEGDGLLSVILSKAFMLAEDDKINALLSQALLGRLGHRPTMVHSGEAAVESWQAAFANGEPFDLVLMDIHMPGMDGLAAAQRIRTAESAGQRSRTPIVALSANASADDRAACLKAGMDDILVKPLDHARLTAMLDRVSRAALAA